MAESTSGGSAWFSALSGKSNDEKEELLDRMLTRLALCDDSKLQDLLAKILPVTIAALSSDSAAIRNKVIEILSHVNKRVKHQPVIGLPLSDLWKLYVESSSAPIVRNFCIVYIEMAIDRVQKEEKQLVAPVFLANISQLPAQHQDILLRITAKVIGECHTSHVSDDVLEKYRTLVGSKDLEIFLEFCLYIILYQPSSQSAGRPAGLSTAQFQRVTGNEPPEYDNLRNRKTGVLNIIEALQVPAGQAYPIYIAACVDSHEPVIRKGEDFLIKRSYKRKIENPQISKINSSNTSQPNRPFNLEIEMRKRTAITWGVAILCFVVLMLVTPAIPQSQEYHNFADQREFFGIPNALNVISNLPFLVGLVGLVLCYHGNYFKLSLPGELCGWTLFFIGVTAVAFGSSYYHLEPNDARLVWDRLPMTVAFTSIIAIFIIERVDARKGTFSIVPLILAGIVSILYWRFFDDLRPYAVIQFVPCIAIPVMAILLPPMYTHSTYWLWAAGFYLLAKIEEAADVPIYNFTRHVVSGHTIKHLCAAMVPVFLTLMLAKREVAEERVSLLRMWRVSFTKVKVDNISCEYSVAPPDEQDK